MLTPAMIPAKTTGNHGNSRSRDLASRHPSPIPRKLASRMKLEKNASNRMYGPIQRMRATSEKRTRKEERKITAGTVSCPRRRQEEDVVENTGGGDFGAGAWAADDQR